MVRADTTSTPRVRRQRDLECSAAWLVTVRVTKTNALLLAVGLALGCTEKRPEPPSEFVRFAHAELLKDQVKVLESCARNLALCREELPLNRQRAALFTTFGSEADFRAHFGKDPGLRLERVEVKDGVLRFKLAGASNEWAQPQVEPPLRGLLISYERLSSNLTDWSVEGSMWLIAERESPLWLAPLRKPLSAELRADPALAQLERRRDELVAQLEKEGLLEDAALKRYLQVVSEADAKAAPSGELHTVYSPGYVPGPRGVFEIGQDTATFRGKLAGDTTELPALKKKKGTPRLHPDPDGALLGLWEVSASEPGVWHFRRKAR